MPCHVMPCRRLRFTSSSLISLQHNRGYDQFLNIVLEDAEEMKGETGVPIGMIVVRGGSVVQFEQLTW
jgi:hypothetical protein